MTKCTRRVAAELLGITQPEDSAVFRKLASIAKCPSLADSNILFGTPP